MSPAAFATSFGNNYPDARIILTSRVVGYKPERLRDAGFRDFMLQDFDAGQIEEFLKLWHQITFSDQEEAERKRQRLAKAIADSRPIKLLAGNPLLLTLMAIINRKEELPRNRIELYEKAAKLLLQNWDTERYLQDYPGLKTKIESWAKTEILRKVALEMQTGGTKAANLIQEDKLINLISEYLATTFGKELLHDHPRNAAEVLVKQLRERNFILCFLGGDSYGFVHRTFLEYFCAADFVHQFEKERSLSLDDLLVLYDAHCREDDWQEVLRLICGQLDESFAGRIIEHLTGLVDLEKWDKKSSLPELLLAVWCLSEVRNLNKIQEKTGGTLLLKVIDRFLSQEKTNEFNNDIFDISQIGITIGANWPGKHLFCFNGQFPHLNMYSIFWPEFLAAIFRQRQWIEQLCFIDDRNLVTHFAINTLSTYWDDNETGNLIKKLSTNHSVAASLYAHEHSCFGSYLFEFSYENKNSQGVKYFDPRQPIPTKQIRKAAKKAGIPPDKIDEAVRSLSAHMGWDITKGSLAGKL